MLKVLYILNHAGKAGTERYVESLIEKLNNKRIKAYFVYNEDGLLVEKLRVIGVETLQIKMRSPFDIIAALKLNFFCRKMGIDIIHAQFLRENYISLFSKIFNPKIKIIYTNHFILKNNIILRITNRLLNPLLKSVISVCNKGKEML